LEIASNAEKVVTKTLTHKRASRSFGTESDDEAKKRMNVIVCTKSHQARKAI
jgi:hypothetical protein